MFRVEAVAELVCGLAVACSGLQHLDELVKLPLACYVIHRAYTVKAVLGQQLANCILLRSLGRNR